jgi:ribosomal-protein-alanine N-acetyltransferase
MQHLQTIINLEKACFPAPWSEQALRGEALPRHYAWNLVVFVDGELRGYFFNWIVMDEMHLLNFAVHPDLQGRGLGGALLDWMLERAAEGGYHSVSLEVRESNQPARGLYESRGFKTIFRRRGYYPDNGEDALIMVRVLNDETEAEQS